MFQKIIDKTGDAGKVVLGAGYGGVSAPTTQPIRK